MERTSLARFESLTSSAATSNTSNRHQRHFHHHHHHHHHLKQCYHYHHHYQHPPEQELTHGIFTNHYHHHHHHHHQSQARPPIVTKTITKTAKEVSLGEKLRINSLDTNTPKLSVSSRFLRLGRKLLLFLFLVCAFTCVALYAIVSASCCTVLTFTDGTTAFQLGPANPAGRYVVAATGNRENENRDPNHLFPVSSNNNRILPNPGRKTFRAARSNSIGSGVTVDVSPTKTGTKILNGARAEGHRGDPATTSLPKSPFRFATAPQNVKKSGGRKGKRKPVSVGTGSDVAAAVAASHAYRGRISSDVGHTKSTRGRNAIFLGREKVPNIGKGRKSEKTKKTTGNDTNKSKSKNKRKSKTEEISKTSANQENGSKNDWRATSAGSSREIIGNARNDHEALLSSSASSSLSSGSQGPKSLISARKITPALPSYGNRSHSPRGAETISKNNSQKEKFTDETKEDNPDDYDEIYDIDDYESEDLSLNYDQEWSTNDEKERSLDGIEFNLNVNESKDRDNSEWMRDNSDNLTETTENVRVRRPLHIQRIRQNATKKLPQAIIIGVKKCGTRALLEYLRLHPDMKGTGPEPHFFDRHYHKGLDWYRNKMPPTIEGQMTIEKTPSYFITKEVPKRIFNMSKNMKILVIVRDPITRAISDYAQLASKRVHMQRFEDLAFVNTTTRIVDTAWNVIRIGVYAKFLERWLHYFPLSQMHFVSGEELISDPASELSRVQDFLGLKRIISEKHFYFNETKGFPCLKKTEGSGHPHCLGKTKGRPHPTVDPMVLKRLRDFYRPFNAKFYHMVQRNFNWP